MSDWPTKDEFARMSAVEVNAWFAWRGIEWRVADFDGSLAAQATELRALSDAATPGPWRQGEGFGRRRWVRPYGGDSIARALRSDADAAFIVAAVNYVRAALASETPETE